MRNKAKNFKINKRFFPQSGSLIIVSTSHFKHLKKWSGYIPYTTSNIQKLKAYERNKDDMILGT